MGLSDVGHNRACLLSWWEECGGKPSDLTPSRTVGCTAPRPQTKAPPVGRRGQVGLAITGLPISPERKPTTPTPSRIVGCTLRGGTPA